MCRAGVVVYGVLMVFCVCVVHFGLGMECAVFDLFRGRIYSGFLVYCVF